MDDTSIASGRACSICWCAYQARGGNEPVGLPCGHSYCRKCLLQISCINRLCPKCRTRFEGIVASMPPNYGLQEILETAVTQQAQAPNAANQRLELKMSEMALTIAEIQLSMKTKEADAKLEVADSNRQHSALRVELQHISARQQLLISDIAAHKFAVTTPAPPTMTAPAMISPGPAPALHPLMPPAPLLSRTAVAVPVLAPTPNPFHTIINLKSNDLQELLHLAANAVSPTVINLCGRHLHHTGLGGTTITGCNLTLKNGIIHLSEGPEEKGSSLCVKGTGIEMQGIKIVGGQVGLWVEAGSNLTLRDCEVRGSHIGVWVGVATNPAMSPSVYHVPSSLTAVRLKVLNTGKGSALAVGGGGTATLDDCEFSGGTSHGILVCGDSPSRLTATNVRCFGNGAKGVVVHHGAIVVMIGCRITDNRDGSVVVRWNGSQAQLINCTLDEAGLAFQGGVLDVK